MMTCSRDGVVDCGMAGRVQNAGRSHLGGVPSCRSTHRARSAPAPASSRQTKGGASRSQDARTAGLERAEEEACTHRTLPCIVPGKIHSFPHVVHRLCMYRPGCAPSRYGAMDPSYMPYPRPGQATAASSNSDGLPGLHFPRFPSKVSPCSDHHLAVLSRLVPSAW